MRLKILLFACAIILLILFGVWDVEAREVYFDIYTDRGGQGIGVPDGTYRVGETVNIGISVSEPSTITITLYGPYTVNIEPFQFGPGSGYFSLGKADPGDIGRWEVVGQACPTEVYYPLSVYPVYPECFKDYTVFFVEPEPVVTVTYTEYRTHTEYRTESSVVRVTETSTAYVTQVFTETHPILTVITRVYYVVILVAVFVPWYAIKRKKRQPEES